MALTGNPGKHLSFKPTEVFAGAIFFMTFTIPVGFKSAFHSHPQDSANNPVVPSSPVSWSVDPPLGVVSLAPAGVQSQDCWVTGAAVGTATLTVTDGAVSLTATINVVPVPLDHFALVVDPPQPA
jgi:hypothetical protein